MHKSVLLEEVSEYLAPKSSNVYIDATVGCGGHSDRILKASAPKGILIGLDLDSEMIEKADNRLNAYGDRYKLFTENYKNILKVLQKLEIEKVDGIVFDLGVATNHFLDAKRGFSFKREAALDMRLNLESKLTARYIVNKWSKNDIVDVLFKYGEERKAKRIAECILRERNKKEIITTKQLAEIIVSVVSGISKKSKVPNYKIHPATKTFQALRIAVNNELSNIEKTLPIAIDLLKTGGRICVITFHSLEDRIVKNIFKTYAKTCLCPTNVLKCVCGHNRKIKIITKKPIIPKRVEVLNNPSARSAKLRVVERISS